MIKIIPGDVYHADRFRSGTSGKGAWEMVVVKGTTGKEEQVLWITNLGTGLQEGGEFRVKSIDGASIKRMPFVEGKVCKNRNTPGAEWRSVIDLNVSIDPVGFTEAPFDFNDLPFSFGDDNPFDGDSNIFADNELPL